MVEAIVIIFSAMQSKYSCSLNWWGDMSCVHHPIAPMCVLERGQTNGQSEMEKISLNITS